MSSRLFPKYLSRCSGASTKIFRSGREAFSTALLSRRSTWETDLRLIGHRIWSGKLREIVYVTHGDALRTARMLRFYERNTIVMVKPDRLRYWISSTAIRDADETLVDLRRQGY